MILIEKLKLYQKQNDLSKAELARQLNTTWTNVHRWLVMGKTPTLPYQRAIEDLLNGDKTLIRRVEKLEEAVFKK